MKFSAITTLEELDAMNSADVLEGYQSAERGDPEPGENRGKAFWHGWCNRQRDFGILPVDQDSRALAKAYMGRERARIALQRTYPNESF